MVHSSRMGLQATRRGAGRDSVTELPRTPSPFPKPSFSFPQSRRTPPPTPKGLRSCLTACLSRPVDLDLQNHGVTQRNSRPSTLSLQWGCKLKQEIVIISTKASSELRSQGKSDQRIIYPEVLRTQISWKPCLLPSETTER